MNKDDEVLDFLEHFGVKGMHWGVRNKSERRIRRIGKQQKRVDRFRRAEAGTASKGDKFILSMFAIPVVQILAEGGISDAASVSLTRERRRKEKILKGKRKTQDFLLKFQGVDVRTLDFSPLK